MQLIRIVTLLILVIQLSPKLSLGQNLSSKEYQVINDLFGRKSNKNIIWLYHLVEPNSVFNTILGENPETTNFTSGDVETFRTLLMDFDFNKGRLDSLDQYQFIFEKRKLDKLIKLKVSKEKGIYLSRPIISKDLAFIYYKTPNENNSNKSYNEMYIIAKNISGSWEKYGQLILTARYVDQLVK
jgi:hypothetical protein